MKLSRALPALVLLAGLGTGCDETEPQVYSLEGGTELTEGQVDPVEDDINAPVDDPEPI